MSRSVAIAMTPPMGFCTWNCFGVDAHEEQVMGAIRALNETGLTRAGYRTFVIDDGWQARSRTASGELQADRSKFPGRMARVSQAIRGGGMEFGAYLSPGRTTCAGFPGSLDHEQRDVGMLDEWGVSYLKHDECSARELAIAEVQSRYALMGRLVRRCSRPVTYAVMTSGRYQPWLWARHTGAQLWRTTRDLVDTWNGFTENGEVKYRSQSIAGIGLTQSELSCYTGPGGWNDPDMLVVGLCGRSPQIPGPGCSLVEYRTHVSMWALLAAPLFIGCDPRTIDAETLALLGNEEVLRIDQDPLGRPARNIVDLGDDAQVWVRPLLGGDIAVGLLNLSEEPRVIGVESDRLNAIGDRVLCDVWTGEELGGVRDRIEASVEPHGCALLRLAMSL